MFIKLFIISGLMYELVILFQTTIITDFIFLKNKKEIEKSFVRNIGIILPMLLLSVFYFIGIIWGIVRHDIPPMIIFLFSFFYYFRKNYENEMLTKLMSLFSICLLVWWLKILR